MNKNYYSKTLLAITIGGLIFSATANTAFAKVSKVVSETSVKISKGVDETSTKVETSLNGADDLAKKFEDLNLSKTDLAKLKTLYAEATALEQKNDDESLKKADEKWAQFEEILDDYYENSSDDKVESK